MNTTTSLSNRDTWRPAWESYPEISDTLRPYSTAAVVPDGSRPRPELWDICKGCILWLPPKADVGEIADPRLSTRDPAFFDHPILVLDVEIAGPRDATVRFAKLTSLRRKPLEHVHPAAHRDRYLPIFPTKPHPNRSTLLRLENEKSKRGMIDTCYVSVGEGVFGLDYRALRCYAAGQKADGYRHRLQKDSFEQVARELDYGSSGWIETGELWEEFIRKHIPGGVRKRASDLGI